MKDVLRNTRQSAGAAVMLALLCSCTTAEPIAPPVEDPVKPPGPELIAPIGVGNQPLWTAVSRYFAPWIYQSWDDMQDFLTLVTYDGDWNALNNWENTYAYPKLGHLYVSMVEDQYRYFIHYGTFHPRDWCEAFDGEACFPPGLGLPFSHENDMEGAKVVVDKRFTTSAWPYGQILTIETVFHHNYKIYRNCSLAGGYTLYVEPDPAFHSSWDGCIDFAAIMNAGYVPPVQTTPAPTTRFNLLIQKKGHGVTVGPHYSTSIYYYPTDNSAQEPNTWRGFEWAAAYRLQWLNQPELNSGSLWSRRLGTVSTPFAVSTPIGPHNASYYSKFSGDNGANNSASPPWGVRQNEDPSLVWLGDWHNHPAWAWAQHYRPFADSLNRYGYCRLSSCRMQNTYVDNIYWDDASLGSGGGTGGGGGGGGTRPCPPTCFTAPPADAPPNQSAPVRAERWDFSRGMEGAQVSGPGLRGTELVTLPDQDWGYAEGVVHAVRVHGTGRVTIRLPFNKFTRDYDQVVARIRRAGQATLRTVRFNWRASNESDAPADRALDVRQKHRHGEWEVVLLDMRTAAVWKDTGDAVANVDVVLDLGNAGEQVVDIDFIVIAN